MTTGRVVLLKGFSDVMARALGIVTFPVVATYVGAGGYGAYGQVHTIVGFIVPFASLGLGAAMVRFFSASEWTPALSRQVLRVGAVIALMAGVIAAVMAALAGQMNDAFLGYPGGEALFRWGSLLVVLGALEVWVLDLLRAREWLLQYSLIQLAETALTVAAVLLLLPAGEGILELIQAAVAIKALVLVVSLGTAFARAKPVAGAPVPERPDYRQMIRFGLPLTVAGLGLWMMNLSDRLIIGHYRSPEDLGRYGAAYTIALLMILASAPLFLPVYQRFMAAALKDDRLKIAADVRLFHRYLSLCLIPTAVLLATLLVPVVVLLGGSSFEVSYWVAVLLVTGLFIDQYNGLAHYLLICEGRTVFLRNGWLACGALNIVLNLIVVPAYGIVGAAAVTFASFVVLEAVFFHAASQYVPLRDLYQVRASLKAIVAAGAGFAGVLAVLAHLGRGGMGLVVAVIAFVALYGLVLALVGGLKRTDLDVLLRAIGARRIAHP